MQKRMPLILITGCSSGIGLELARLFSLQTNYRVVITARPGSINALKEEFQDDDFRILVRPLDVIKPESRNLLIKELEERWDGIDILINNAGILYRSVVEHMSDEDEQNQVDVNYLGPFALIRLCLPSMRKKGRGKIINVSSVAGMMAMPTMASYSASKYALEGGSEALWYEMKPLGINVTLVQCGFIKSKSFLRVKKPKAALDAIENKKEYWDYYESMEPFIGKLMNRSLTTPEKVAKLILKVVQTQSPRLRIFATLDAKIFYYLRRWLPRRYFHPVLYMLLPNVRNWGKQYTKKRK